MEPIQKIARLLRAPQNVLAALFDKMEKITGKKDVAAKICQENEVQLKQKLQELGIREEKADAQYVQAELLKKTNEADKSFYEFLGRPDFSNQSSCQKMIGEAESLARLKKGFFLKEEKLRDFLFLNPPKNIMEALGYQKIGEMLEKEDSYEIFAALRFVEGERWLNEVFFRPYNDLSADSFEDREIKVKILSEKWGEIGAKFVGKKLHHISHLKEIGFVFVIPGKKGNGGYLSGQSLETFSLILHYIHEIDFYCRLFRNYAQLPNFGGNLVCLLSGKVSGNILPSAENKVYWRLIQRYLAKLDTQDPRLFEPHVNSETVHWLKAEKEIDGLAQKNPQIKLDFWRGIDDFVGEVFPAGKKGEEIVSFDLLDCVVALTHGGLEKYLYHQQEALWNKIFIDFTGEEKLEEMIMKNMEKGFIET